MNDIEPDQLNIETFRMWDYPAFAVFMGYVWMEMMNPVIGYSLQIIPKVPNAAIMLILCYRFMPPFLKQLLVPFSPVKWALPFLVIASINLPFIEYQQGRSIIDLLSTWFWVLFLLPLMMRVLATPSGRWHFAMFTTASISYLALIYLVGLITDQFDTGGFNISYHHLAPGVILMTPIIIGYIIEKSGLTRYLLVGASILLMASAIPAGARAIWLFIPLELVLMILFVLPKSRIILGSVVGMVIFYAVFSSVDVRDYYSETALDKLDVRLRKTSEWQEDDSIWRRVGMFKKAGLILRESPFLGIGYSNRSFASYDGGDVEVLGHFSNVGKYDAHNSYLNILAGTGILGFLAFLYYLGKVAQLLYNIPLGLWKRIDMGTFIVSMIGSLAWFFINTNQFSSIVYQTTLIIAIYLHIHNFRIEYIVSDEEKEQ